VISLHRLGHQAEEFFLNPDLIVTVEANPDTVITLTTGTKIVVAEAPERVVEAIRQFRIEVLAGSLADRRQGPPQPHGTYARRAHQGMLRAVERGEDDGEGEPGGRSSE
jgi:flagellar protein FlbD